MRKLILKIKERGRYIEIPGLAPFRTPAEVDVTKVKLSILLQSLHSCNVENYEINSKSDKDEVVYNEETFMISKKKTDNENIDDRLDRMEDMLLTILSGGQNNFTSEQITNRLNRIEKMIRNGSKVVNPTDESPVIEEIEERYIPEIDVAEMKLSGNITESVESKDEKGIEDSVDLLSNLRRSKK